MKTTLLYSSLLFFVLGTSFAHEIAVAPVVISHKSVAEHHIAQLNVKVGTVCNTDYITVTNSDGSKSQRKSVDCDE